MKKKIVASMPIISCIGKLNASIVLHLKNSSIKKVVPIYERMPCWLNGKRNPLPTVRTAGTRIWVSIKLGYATLWGRVHFLIPTKICIFSLAKLDILLSALKVLRFYSIQLPLFYVRWGIRFLYGQFLRYSMQPVYALHRSNRVFGS